MSQFIQLHLLTAYPPSNLNRDDLGRPKTAIVGGFERLRVSSQSLKRAWRTSEIFESAVSEWTGKRTKRLGKSVYDRLIEKGAKEKQAEKWASAIAGQFGKVKKDNPLEIEQLSHIAPAEWDAVMSLADTLAVEGREPVDDELNLLRSDIKAVDISLFGRMLASKPAFNVEAAVQVAHAFTVNPVKIDDDFFTAVDDLNTHEEDAGAAHMGDAGFGSGVFYLYICINKTLLIENLQGDEDLANKTLAALVEAVAKVAPTGKQNSFASRAYTSYLLAESGSQQPRSLSVSFFKPINPKEGEDQISLAIDELESQRKKLDAVYGDCADKTEIMNAQSGEGSLQKIIDIVVGA